MSWISATRIIMARVLDTVSGTVTVALLAGAVVLFAGCESDDSPSPSTSTDVPVSFEVENSKMAKMSPPAQTIESQIQTEVIDSGTVIDDQSLEQVPEAVEPRADEIAHTTELESELGNLVQAASAMLEPQQAQELMTRADGWMQDGFGCPQDADREACRQFNLRNLIKEIENQMRDFNTEY